MSLLEIATQTEGLLAMTGFVSSINNPAHSSGKIGAQ